MSVTQNHIINKQIVEFQISEANYSLDIQNTISKLYHDQWKSIINTVLDDQFENPNVHYQIDRLTIDLGEVTLKNITGKLSKQMTAVLNQVIHKEEIQAEEVKHTIPAEVKPLQALIYFLEKGRMPWWGIRTKTELTAELDVILQKTSTELKQLLVKLKENRTYVQRYVQICSKEQLRNSIQIILDLSKGELLNFENDVVAIVKQKTSKQSKEKNILEIVYSILFQELDTQLSLKQYKKIVLSNIASKLSFSFKEESKHEYYKEIKHIDDLIQKYQKLHTENNKWQELLSYIFTLIQGDNFEKIPVLALNGLRKGLENLDTYEENDFDTKEKIKTEKLVYLTKQLVTLQKTIQKNEINEKTTFIKSRISAFDSTDFISVENSGLVLLCAFLPQLFKHLKLTEDRAFLDLTSAYKALAVLHFVCYGDNISFFEGQLSLIKILCGLDAEESIEIQELSTQEKTIIEDFLAVVIAQGESWGKLSIDGFRASYLLRQASLKIRDNHWQLQIETKTHDIVLNKIPWNFKIIKLPWMKRVLMVEWNG
ncbi:contractile injection system tape measure protein [Tenacibaculum jejuense]|uniref:Uncharacterized protein n=1 Tax=Tenacibaculum jejuense TaxID=584609 RepID=A0A238UCM3_9FLAO|nr:contractile injection system tape measure protein [Tenacibaculum jejuense]SNR16921.1 protein of unknown function [Tenacibaculum jejuense]